MYTHSWALVHPWTSAHLKPCITSKHFRHLAAHISHADVLTRSWPGCCSWEVDTLRISLVCEKCQNWWRHNFHLVAEQSIHGRLSQEDQNTITLETLELRCGSIVGVHRRWTWDQETEAYVDWWWLRARVDNGHGDKKSHCYDPWDPWTGKKKVQVRVRTGTLEGCVPGTDEPEVCALKTYERFACSKHNTRQLFRKMQPTIRNSVCIASWRLFAWRMRHDCGPWNSLISKQNIYTVWLRCICTTVKVTRFPGNAPMMRDACTQIRLSRRMCSTRRHSNCVILSRICASWKLNVCISSGRLSLRAAECWLGWRRQGSSQLFWNHRKHLVVWIFLFLVQSWWWLMTATQRIHV